MEKNFIKQKKQKLWSWELLLHLAVLLIFLLVYWSTNRRFDFILLALLVFAIHKAIAAWNSPQANYRKFVFLTSIDDKRGWTFVLVRIFCLLILGNLIISKMLISQDYSTLSISISILAVLLAYYVIMSLISAPKPSRVAGFNKDHIYLIIDNIKYEIASNQLKTFEFSVSKISLTGLNDEVVHFSDFRLTNAQWSTLKTLAHQSIYNFEVKPIAKDDFF